MKNTMGITFTSKVKILTHNYRYTAIAKEEATKLSKAFKKLENNGNNDTIYFYRGQCKNYEPYYELTIVEKRGKNLFTASAGKLKKDDNSNIIVDLYKKARENLKQDNEKYLLKYYL